MSLDNLAENKQRIMIPFFENLNYDKRFEMYKEMLNNEPRMWTNNHHYIKMITNTLVINSSIYSLYSMYMKYYNSRDGMIVSLFKSNKMKISLFSIFVVNSTLLYLNYFKIHEYVYAKYYQNISNEDYIQMYDKIVTLKKLKQEDIYRS